MRASAFILITFLLSLTSCFMREEVDMIVHNATIYVVDESFTKSSAMAISNGKIIETGPNREILNKYRSSNIVDVKTQFVYPGFIDAHCHFLGYGLSLQEVDLVGTKSFDDVLDVVMEFEKSSTTEWITGRGWDQNDWKVQEFPNKSILDSLFPDRPVMIRRVDGHAAVANQEALNRANITTETEISGGKIEIIDGELSGILLDNAIDLVNDVIPKASESEYSQALLAAQEKCFKVGLTTVDDAGLGFDIIKLIQTMQKSGELKMKIYAMLNPSEENYRHFLVSGPLKTERLNACSFKYYADGALGSRGACLIDPYSDDPDNSGFLLQHPEYYRKSAKKMIDAGFQMNTHCIGDSANRYILDIYAEFLQESNDKRWRIEHAQVVSKEDLDKFGKYNIIPSVQPTHGTSDMYWAKDRLGEERVKGAYAYHDLLQQLGIIANGSDFPVESINPLYGFFAAVERKDFANFPEGGFQMENSMSREDALKAMTIWAAISNFEENEKGSLEPGKAADFVILDRDIIKADLSEVQNIRVLKTFINGEQVYSSY
ncbi:MAG TPA: amidohydrolase [Flavobacteriales bacterium]|nr:amidohydrolase [Flavobacteriales bacterium]HIO71521.1 amidohydrolase [Flavobacteriales bacterium]